MGRVDVFPPQSNNKKDSVIPWTDVFEKRISSSPEEGICDLRVFHLLLYGVLYDNYEI